MKTNSTTLRSGSTTSGPGQQLTTIERSLYDTKLLLDEKPYHYSNERILKVVSHMIILMITVYLLSTTSSSGDTRVTGSFASDQRESEVSQCDPVIALGGR